jgi:hypothetical protein
MEMANPKEASTNLEYVSPSLHGEHERSKINRHEFGVHRSRPQHIAPPRRDPHHILLKLSKEINETRLNEATSVRRADVPAIEVEGSAPVSGRCPGGARAELHEAERRAGLAAEELVLEGGWIHP